MTYRNKIWVSATTSILIFFLVYIALPKGERSLVNIISIIGSLVSMLGILIAYFQILSIKEISITVRDKIDGSILLTNSMLMIADLSRMVEMINEIQGFIKDDKIDICILRMKDLKRILNSLKHHPAYKRFVSTKQLSTCFTNFNIDLDNFHKHSLQKNNKIDKVQIIKNLEELSTLFLNVETKLKSHRNDS